MRLVASGDDAAPYNRRIRRLVLEGRWGGSSGRRRARRSAPITSTRASPGWTSLNVDPPGGCRPGGGPQYDVTVYCLHNDGILGPAKRVTAFSGLVLPVREFRGREIPCDMDDNTMLLIDFGEAVFAFAYGTVAGRVTQGFHPSIFGTTGSVVGTLFGERDLRLPEDHQPHVVGEHARMGETHVFEDLMQLVDAVRDGTPTLASPEHARHVIDIIEAGYRSAETGRAVTLHTTFDPLPIEALEAARENTVHWEVL